MQCCRFSHNLSQRSFPNKSEAPLGHATLRHSKPIENPKAMPQPVSVAATSTVRVHDERHQLSAETRRRHGVLGEYD